MVAILPEQRGDRDKMYLVASILETFRGGMGGKVNESRVRSLLRKAVNMGMHQDRGLIFEIPSETEGSSDIVECSSYISYLIGIYGFE